MPDFFALYRYWDFYKLKASTSTSKKITICFTEMVWNETRNTSKVCLQYPIIIPYIFYVPCHIPVEGNHYSLVPKYNPWLRGRGHTKVMRARGRDYWGHP